ncbi:MAG: aminoglycoside phosphotransferase family protein [Clostridiales bacterium]|nr:aminoglycoside phosphotransferase family protein [Clostridiales bacterium]
MVRKAQKRWARPGDPDSWRREYDLYQSNLEALFTSDLRRPKCCHSALWDDKTELWLEYIDGVSGAELTIEMLEQAALAFGRFQGRVSAWYDAARPISGLGDRGFFMREFNQWHTQTFSYDYLISGLCRMPEFIKEMLKNGSIRLVDGKSFEYGCLRSSGCGLPEDLKKMIMDIDERKDDIFKRQNKLPVVLCHRDFWHENIFFTDGGIRLIDWDTAGWGFPGEDIASLIADEMPAERLEENYNRLVPAYVSGLSENKNAPAVEEMGILDMILMKFGYRMVQEYMFAETNGEKDRVVNALTKIYELKKTNGL